MKTSLKNNKWGLKIHYIWYFIFNYLFYVINHKFIGILNLLNFFNGKTISIIQKINISENKYFLKLTLF